MSPPPAAPSVWPRVAIAMLVWVLAVVWSVAPREPVIFAGWTPTGVAAVDAVSRVYGVGVSLGDVPALVPPGVHAVEAVDPGWHGTVSSWTTGFLRSYPEGFVARFVGSVAFVGGMEGDAFDRPQWVAHECAPRARLAVTVPRFEGSGWRQRRFVRLQLHRAFAWRMVCALPLDKETWASENPREYWIDRAIRTVRPPYGNRAGSPFVNGRAETSFHDDVVETWMVCVDGRGAPRASRSAAVERKLARLERAAQTFDPRFRCLDPDGRPGMGDGVR